MSDQPNVAVIGAGAWGTALARVLANKGVPTLIWAREPEVVASIRDEHENSLFLAGFDLGSDLAATSDLDEAFAFGDIVVNAVPTQHMRSVIERAGAAPAWRRRAEPSAISNQPSPLRPVDGAIVLAEHPSADC